MADYINYLRSLAPESSESESNTSSMSTESRNRDEENGENEELIPPKQPRLATNTANISGGASTSQTNNSNSNLDAGGSSQPFQQGTNIFSDANIEVNVQAVEHQRHTRFRAEDHLYQVTLHPTRRTAPILLSLETALKEALMAILLRLQNNYPSSFHHQVYITIIEKKIKHGLNTGNYDLAAPPIHVVNRALTILHSYLKSNQTMKLNDSFKIQIKILSHRHTAHLISQNPRFQKKIFRDYKRIRN